jgi:hypothetical protein
MHFDGLGLIVQADGDGGDTAQRVGMFYFAHQDARAFKLSIMILEVAPGIWVRHPTQEGFRKDPAHFSRDQQDALMVAAGHYKRKDVVYRTLKAQLSRFGRYQNKDWANLGTACVYIRALRARYLWPLLVMLDFGFVINAVFLWQRNRHDPDKVDDNNHIVRLQQAYQYMPTPVSWLARKLYKWIRPKNLGNTIKGETCPIMGSLAWYHRAENGGNPEIVEAYRPLIKRW